MDEDLEFAKTIYWLAYTENTIICEIYGFTNNCTLKNYEKSLELH